MDTENVLVTGGAGFIGSHVAYGLVLEGYRVTVLDDLSGGFRENLPPECEFVQGNIVDDRLVEDLFASRKFDLVYHLAAYAAEGLSHFIRRYNYINNIIGSATLLNAAIRHRTRRFVFTSSIAVYGAGQLPMTEDMTPQPEDPYGIAKRAVELDLMAAYEMFGLEYVIFRPHNVYGEKQNIFDPCRNVVGIFIRCLLQGEPMPIFGDGSQTRAFSYIKDVAPIIARSGFDPGARNRIFNVGADEPVNVLTLAHLVAEIFGMPPRFIHLPPRQEVQHAFSNHAALREVFGPLQSTPLREGLERMAVWARGQVRQKLTPFMDIEIMDKLPESWARLLARHDRTPS